MNKRSPNLTPDDSYAHIPYTDRELRQRRAHETQSRSRSVRNFMAGVAIGAVGLAVGIVGVRVLDSRTQAQAQAVERAQQPIEDSVNGANARNEASQKP